MYRTLVYIDDMPEIQHHDTLAQAMAYAEDSAADGHDCQILTTFRTVWAEDYEERDMDRYNGVRH